MIYILITLIARIAYDPFESTFSLPYTQPSKPFPRLRPSTTTSSKFEIFATESTSAVLPTPIDWTREELPSHLTFDHTKKHSQTQDIMAPIAPSPLVERARAVAEEFEYTPEQVNAGVQEFLRLMGENSLPNQ